MTTNLLLDDIFLKELYQHRNKEVFAKVIALTKDEDPIEEIQGRISGGGSINIDGTSTVRRSCSLTMIANDMDTNNYYWGLNTKFKLEIGLKVPNEVRNYSGDGGTTYPYLNAPEIIWFPEGIYVITSFSSSQSTNSYTISLQGKDKMCLLNGEMGGSLYASIDFGVEDYIKNTYKEVDMGISGKDYIAGKYYTTDNLHYNPAVVTARTYEPNLYYTRTMTPETTTYTLSTGDFNPAVTYYYKVYNLCNDSAWNATKTYYQKISLTVHKSVPIKDIIKEMVHEYGQEPWGNIVINDLDTYGLELLQYRGTEPMYLIISEGDADDVHEVVQMTLVGSTPCEYYYTNPTTKASSWISTTLGNEDIIQYNPRVTLDFSNAANIAYTKIRFSSNLDKHYSVAKIVNGDTCGYRLTDVTYAGDLISGVGESITSILDKIVAMLGNFEYFYDTDGKFIFRKKQTYLDKSWNNIVENNGEVYADNSAYMSSTVWSFEDSLLVSSFANTPSLSNVKNDFALWGTRKSATGKEIPVHLRYAIDKKPHYYRNFNGQSFVTTLEEYNACSNQLYANALRYTKMKNPDGLVEPIQQEDGSWTDGWWNLLDWANYYKQLTGELPLLGIDNYITKRCQFNNLNNYFEPPQINQHYHNMAGEFIYNETKGQWDSPASCAANAFGIWNARGAQYGVAVIEINSDNSLGYYGHTIGKNINCNLTYQTYFEPAAVQYRIASYIYAPSLPQDDFNAAMRAQVESNIFTVNWRELIYQMATDYIAHGHEENFLLQVRNNNGTNAEGEWRYPTGYTGYEQYYVDMEGFWRQLYYPFGAACEVGAYTYNYDTTDTNKGWRVEVLSNPETINFWFDFLDTDADINKFAVPTIGDRSKSVNDNTIKAIYFREVPTTIFATNIAEIERQSGYTYLQYGAGMEGLFNVSAQGKSAKDVLDDYLYKYAYCIESVTLTAIPLYHLEPNTRILVDDKNSGIEGEYLITRISLPLTFNGTMSISATKAIDRLY